MEDVSPPYPPGAARLLFYMHSTSTRPPDIVFTISGIYVRRESGDWVSAAEGPFEVSARDLVDRQVLLKEAFVEPGSYTGMKLVLSAASVGRGEGRASLSLPGEGGEVVLPLRVTLKAEESFVLSLAWNPDRSLRKRVFFEPAIEVEPQVPSAREKLLFVSNSGSNYISIVDMDIERVVAAVTVGSAPMGMVMDPIGEKLYVVNSGSGTLSEVSVSHFAVRETIVLTEGFRPVEIAYMPNLDGDIEGKLYVTNRASNDVTVVSTVKRRVMNTIEVGMSPSAIASDAERRDVYVTNEHSNNLMIINAVDDSVASTITVDNRPAGIMVGDGKLYVLNEGSRSLSVVSLSSREVEKTVTLHDPPRRGLLGFGYRLFVTNALAGTVSIFSSEDVIRRVLRVGAGPVGIVGYEDRERLYVANSGGVTLTLIDPLAERVVKEITVGEAPYGLVTVDRMQ
ncbi:MAG: hypothetical protein V3W31_00140 [Thermodesulfobacteriota bacterium]